MCGSDNSTVWSLSALRSFEISAKLKPVTGSDIIQCTHKLINVEWSIPEHVLERNEKNMNRKNCIFRFRLFISSVIDCLTMHVLKR